MCDDWKSLSTHLDVNYKFLKKKEKIKEKKSNKKAGLAFIISCCICVCHEVHYFVLLHVQTYMSFIIFKLFNEQHIQKQIFVCPHTCMHTTSICTHAYTPLLFFFLLFHLSCRNLIFIVSSFILSNSIFERYQNA